MAAKDIKRYCVVKEEADKLLEAAINKLGLSARAYSRVLKSKPHHSRPRRLRRHSSRAHRRGDSIPEPGLGSLTNMINRAANQWKSSVEPNPRAALRRLLSQIGGLPHHIGALI